MEDCYLANVDDVLATVEVSLVSWKIIHNFLIDQFIIHLFNFDKFSFFSKRLLLLYCAQYKLSRRQSGTFGHWISLEKRHLHPY